MKPRLLDLFSGAGGAAKGYQRAGFYVVGVDIKPQPHYCGDEFYQADALTFPLDSYDAYHASPPCQGYSRLQIAGKTYPKLIEPTRQSLTQTGLSFVIENVVGAPLIEPVILCGSMFGLGVWRHRLFETHGFQVVQPQCSHTEHPYPLDVTGTGGPCLSRTTPGGGIHRKPRNMAQASEAMGIDWMTRKELTQAIPPAYTEFIGGYLMKAIEKGQAP